MLYGFSTGALAKGDFNSALSMLEGYTLPAIELSALRVQELPALLDSFATLPLRGYEHVTIHAPSKFAAEAESAVADQLARVAHLVNGFIVHVEAIVDAAPWRALGAKVFVENADGRKRTGRTTEELLRVLDQLPDAKVCFDIAHVHQVDPTLLEAYRMVHAIGDRIGQIHVSQLDHACHHQALSRGIATEFARLAPLLPHTAVILESVVTPDLIARQLKLARACFEGSQHASTYGLAAV